MFQRRSFNSLFLACAIVLFAVLPLEVSQAIVAMPLGNVSRVFEENDKFYLETQQGKVELQFLEHGAVRVQIGNKNSDSESYLTVPGALHPVKFEHHPDQLEVVAPGVRVKYALKPFSLIFFDNTGKVLLEWSEFTWGDLGGDYRLSYKKTDHDRYYGLGEPYTGRQYLIGRNLLSFTTRKINLNRDGQNVPIWNKHIPPSRMGLPFFFSPRGYGLMVDNYYKADFDLSASDSILYMATGGPARFYFFAGTPYQVLDAYSQLTGRTPMPPRWVTGYMQSRYGYNSEAEFRSLMDNFRSRHIPCDVLIFDLDWYGYGNGSEIRMGNLEWSKAHFPSALELQKELAARGFKAITILDPYVMHSSKNFAEARDKNLGAKNSKGQTYLFPYWGPTIESLLLDFSNPEARAWFGSKVKAIHDTGVKAWWTDKNEPELDWPGMFFNGQPDYVGHNLQPLLMHKAIADMYARELPDERLFIMSRGGFVGDWRYGTGIWSGDINSSWGHLRNQVQVGIESGLSGWGFWNSDTGGFVGVPSAELYTRWMQFSAFCPIYRAHGNHSIREPWAFGEKTEAYVKKIMDLRYRLSPYHYTTFYEMHAAGKPPIRAMFLEFPEDPKAFEAQDQYMYGPWLLVAPVTAPGARSQQVYLPAGKWTDFWTEKTYAGPGRIQADAPLDRIPLFVREGAILPMGPLMQYMGEKPVNPITLHVYPGTTQSTYKIYDDDGATNKYLTGEFALTPVTVTPENIIQIKVGPRQGNFAGMVKDQAYVILCHHVSLPGEVRLNGKIITESNQDVESTTSPNAAWSYDAEKKIAKVYIPRGDGLTVDISAEQTK